MPGEKVIFNNNNNNDLREMMRKVMGWGSLYVKRLIDYNCTRYCSKDPLRLAHFVGASEYSELYLKCIEWEGNFQQWRPGHSWVGISFSLLTPRIHCRSAQCPPFTPASVPIHHVEEGWSEKPFLIRCIKNKHPTCTVSHIRPSCPLTI